MKKKILFSLLITVLLVILFYLAFFGFPLKNNLRNSDRFRIITDMDDRQTEVPTDPHRIACMHGVSSERIIILGKGERLVLSMKPSPWMLKFYPEVRKYQTLDHSFTASVERLLGMNIDLVLYSPFPGEAEKYRAAGIRTACGFSPQKRPKTIEEYSENFKRQFIFFGDLFGPETKIRAENYCKYFDKKIVQIRSITSKIPVKDRPSVYYGGRSGNPLYSQGRSSVMHWNTEVAGGNFLPQALNNNFVEVNMEKVYAWDPDIVLLSGWCDSPDILKKNPNWNSLRAVRNGKVYLIPQGIFTWDHASGESILLMIYMAKIFYPDQFKDWDMITEMKSFYSEIYKIKITDRDAERILKRLPPL